MKSKAPCEIPPGSGCVAWHRQCCGRFVWDGAAVTACRQIWGARVAALAWRWGVKKNFFFRQTSSTSGTGSTTRPPLRTDTMILPGAQELTLRYASLFLSLAFHTAPDPM